jgi:hypothetical protein
MTNALGDHALHMVGQTLDQPEMPRRWEGQEMATHYASN